MTFKSILTICFLIIILHTGISRRIIYRPTTWYLEEAIGWRINPGINIEDGEQVAAAEHPDDGKTAKNVKDARHFFEVELDGEKITVKSINYKGEVFRKSSYNNGWKN